MSGRQFHIGITPLYAFALHFIYFFEIAEHWGYLGFPPPQSLLQSCAAVGLATLMAVGLPIKFDTRSFMLSILHYLYFIPALVLASAFGFSIRNLFICFSVYFIIHLLSRARINAPKIISTPFGGFSALILGSLFLAVFILAIYGGLENFSLDIANVYQFRREAAANLPELFGYVYSGVSKVVAPAALVLGLYFRSKLLVFVPAILVVLLFGMTHHKSVLFLAITSVMFFLVLTRAKDVRWVAYIFVAVAATSMLETLWVDLSNASQRGAFNTFIVRRSIFVPPLLDTFYLDFFSERAKIFWSTSRFGLGLMDNPYDKTAPFLIGREFFGKETMSANTGLIGSGFSHAGYYGVVFYAALAGLLLALLQSYGRAIGHAFVSSVSFSVFISIVTSTDFSTAILTHGLLLLIVLLLIFPRDHGRGNSS